MGSTIQVHAQVAVLVTVVVQLGLVEHEEKYQRCQQHTEQQVRTDAGLNRLWQQF